MLDNKYIWTPDKPDFNYFTDLPANLRRDDFIDDFVGWGLQYPAFAAKFLFFDYRDPVNCFEFADFQLVILDMLWKTIFPMLVASRGAGKTFMLAVYALLKATLSQGSDGGEKVVITGASFRQSKMVFT